MSELVCARLQMALTLGFHIVFACVGVGFPVLLLAAEGLGIARGDAGWTLIARRWSKAFAVLFAVGAVSGTVLSFELGLLWPAFLARYGAVIGLPFILEGYAFFLEAIFVGIYLYGWSRLSPRLHWLSGVPIALSGVASAAFVVTVNAWMNVPTGFSPREGPVTQVDPVGMMFSPASPPQIAHMVMAAYMVTGFMVAAFYATLRLRGDRGRYTRRAMLAGLALGAVFAVPQAMIGDWAAKTVATTQPVKLAAMEGQFRTEPHAPLRIGGWPDEDARTTRFALEIPGGLSWLAYGDAAHVVVGLDDVPPDRRPPVHVVHLAFQLMVGLGTALVALALAAAAGVLRPALYESRLFLAGVALSGPAAVIAMEAGWVVTEVGRQPWIVQGLMLTRDAVTHAPGIAWSLAASILIYAVLTAGSIAVLKLLARVPLPEEERGG
jgi:cytochrome d ubiquinol oxidase subunit I